jgi:glycosyltransferase involved in cell wall biosynthesis
MTALRRRALLLLEDLGGGTGNHVCQMVAEWKAMGWEVVLVTQRAPLVHHLPRDVDVRVMRVIGWYDHFPLAQVRRLVVLRNVARALRADVVHTYFFWSIVYGRILKLLGHVPLLVENREDAGFSWGRVVYGFLRLTRRIPDRVICVARAVRQVVLEREGADPDRTIVVPNGVAEVRGTGASRVAARREFGFGEEHVVIGMVANLPRTVKGGDRLLDAVGAIVAAVPTARFLLVGQGTETGTLAPQLRARRIERYVIGTGYRPDVEPCYAAMDISVLTSSTEGLSITLLESMQRALPTVVTRVGGNPEVVVDGVTGFLVPVDDPGAFVGRVTLLARDPALRRKMGEAGRRRVAERFALADVARRYLQVYETLLTDSGRRPEPHMDGFRRMENKQ